MIQVTITLILSFILSCCGLNPCMQEEVFRKTSPDNIVDVVVINIDCGVTTSINNSIFIVPKGELIDKQNPVFVADKVCDLKVKWIKPKFLAISYVKARIFKFTNFWNSRHIDYFRYEVNIQEERIR